MDRRRQLAAEQQRLVARIRRLRGFGRFQLPPTTDELTRVAARGPIVAINVSEHGCDALIVTHNGIRAIPLPHVSPDAVAEQSRRLRLATDPQRGGTRTEVRAVHTWLWD